MRKKINKQKKPVSLSHGSAKPVTLPGKHESFFKDVYDVVRQVPSGRVTTYGAIAAYLGTKMSARMVGWAMNACHQSETPVPAQRVVNRNGILSGKHHFRTPTEMEDLLRQEGVVVDNDKILHFSSIYWDPTRELSLD